MSIETRFTVFLFYDTLLLTFGVIGNVIILVTFGRNSVLKPPTIMLILALALSDLAVCVFVGTTHVAITTSFSSVDNYTTWTTPPYGNSFCKFTLGVILPTQYFTVLLHGLVAFNRYITVSRPAGRRMTRRGTCLLLIIICIPSLSIGAFATTTEGCDHMGHIGIGPCIPLKYTSVLMITWFITIISTALLIIFLNTKMVLHVRRLQGTASVKYTKSILQSQDAITNPSSTESINLSPSLPPSPDMLQTAANITDRYLSVTQPSNYKSVRHLSLPSLNSPIHPPTSDERRFSAETNLQDSISRDDLSRQHSQRNVIVVFRPRNFQQRTLDRMTKTLLLTTMTFVFTHIPFFVVTAIPQDTMESLNEKHQNIFGLVVFLQNFSLFNYVINPVIYGLTSTRFRREFRRLWNQK